MEALSLMMGKAANGVFFKGFEVGNDRDSIVSVSHLLFADDSLVFCDAHAAQLGYLQMVLLYFQAASGA